MHDKLDSYLLIWFWYFESECGQLIANKHMFTWLLICEKNNWQWIISNVFFCFVFGGCTGHPPRFNLPVASAPHKERNCEVYSGFHNNQRGAITSQTGIFHPPSKMQKNEILIFWPVQHGLFAILSKKRFLFVVSITCSIMFQKSIKHYVSTRMSVGNVIFGSKTTKMRQSKSMFDPRGPILHFVFSVLFLSSYLLHFKKSPENLCNTAVVSLVMLSLV